MTTDVTRKIRIEGRLAFTKNMAKADKKSGKFSCGIIMEKDAECIEAIKELINDVASANNLPKGYKKPLKVYKGVEVEEGEETTPYAIGKYVLNVNTKFAITFYNVKGHEIPAEEFHPGDYIFMAVSAYPWTYDNKKGVSFNVDGIVLEKSVKPEERFKNPNKESSKAYSKSVLFGETNDDGDDSNDEEDDW